MKSIVMLTLGSAVLTACGNANSAESQMFHQVESADNVNQTLSGTTAYSSLTTELEALGALKQAVNVPNNQSRVSCIPGKR
jgi:hypothetical protein